MDAHDAGGGAGKPGAGGVVAWGGAGLLCVAMAVTFRFAVQYAGLLPEFAQTADTFGYLQMAEDLRQGSAPHGLPRFTFDSWQSRVLLEHLKKSGMKRETWADAMTVPAYHYQEGSDRFVCQYPPGVALLLRFFPRGSAFYRARLLLIGVMAAVFVAAAARTFWRLRSGAGAEALASLAFVAAAGQAAMYLLGATYSFSIDLIWLPLMAGIGLLYFSNRREGAWGRVLAMLAGAAFGYGILVRIATAFLAPGFAALAWPRRRREWVLGRPASFLVGMIAGGIVPQMVHQWRLTGSALETTYMNEDVAGPTVKSVLPNAVYYFFGDGSQLMGMLALAALAFGILCVRGRGALRYAWAAALFFGVPTLYFLVHEQHTPYYQFPTIAACMFSMAFGALAVGEVAGPQPMKAHGSMVAAAVAGALVLWGAWDLPDLSKEKALGSPASVASIPAELKDPRAWIYAERLSGTFWYYHGIAAITNCRGDQAVRREIYRFVAARGEPQYLVYDNPMQAPLLEELRAWGAGMQQVGTFVGQPVVRIEWPAEKRRE